MGKIKDFLAFLGINDKLTWLIFVPLSSMLNLLQNITQKLSHLQIPYMLTGSMAMGFYTIPRNTLDLVVELNSEDMRAFLQILKNEFYISEDALQIAITQRGMFNIIDHQSGFKVDIILTQKTLYAQTAFQRV